MTTADEHAVEAQEWARDAVVAVGSAGGSERAADGVVRALNGITSALLALRPGPVPVVDGLPTRVGAIVRATVAGERGCLLVHGDTDSLAWLMMPGGSWFGDHELSDVEVLFPGVPS